ncbi:MAG: transposase [bacterium]|nr:transposase [bacterium]
MIERFFLTLKQECVWLQRFESRDHAFQVVAEWLDRYDAVRPHSALGYLTPKAYREQLAPELYGNEGDTTAALTARIRAIHAASGGQDGVPRVVAELRAHDGDVA